MRVATKLGLADWFDAEAAATVRRLNNTPYVSPQYLESCERYVHNCRAAAYALRRMTTEQEVDLLEWQFGGPDGIGSDSYPNPITVLRPPPPKPPAKRTWWQKFRDPLYMMWMPGDGP